MCLVNDNFGIKNSFLSDTKVVLQVEVHCSYACVAFEMVSKVSMNIYFWLLFNNTPVLTINDTLC